MLAVRAGEPPAAAAAAAWLVPLAVGAGLSVALGVYGKPHTGTGVAVAVAGSSSLLTAKLWTATLSAVFAVAWPSC